MKLFSFLILVLIVTGLSFAQTNYYVDNNLGSDQAGNGMGSGSTAWKSIEYAVKHVENPATNTIIIHISSGEYNLESNQIDINRNFKDLTLTGDNANNTIIEASSTISSATSRVMEIYPGNNIKLNGLTIRYGFTKTSGSGVLNDSGSVIINNCKIVYNTGGTRGVGGAISNIKGKCVIDNSTISFNTASDSCYGGGIGSLDGICTISNSTISNNSAAGGGGIAVISFEGVMNFNIINSTISENKASYFCGGIRIDRWKYDNFSINVNISNCTIFNNTSTGQSGIGGVGVLNYTQSGYNVIVKNSIIAGNTAVSRVDISGSIISGDYNLIEDKSSVVITGDTTHNIYNVSPKCQPLALNNSLNGTMTNAISLDSPAKDVIPADSPNGSLLYDQRGAPRKGNDDIGSYEYWNDSNWFPTGIGKNIKSTPGTFELSQNYPNPFNPSTIIRYSIPASGYINLSVYNSIGQKIAILVQGFENAGIHSVEFKSAGLPSGIYFYRLQENSFISTKKMILLK